jgi:hypothetical protein
MNDKELEDWAKEPIPDDFFPPAPSGPTERLIDLLPPEKQEAFRQRCKQFSEREDEI